MRHSDDRAGDLRLSVPWQVKNADGDPAKLASLDRWNPITLAINVLFWCGRMLWKLVMLGLRKL